MQHVLGVDLSHWGLDSLGEAGRRRSGHGIAPCIQHRHKVPTHLLLLLLKLLLLLMLLLLCRRQTRLVLQRMLLLLLLRLGRHGQVLLQAGLVEMLQQGLRLPQVPMHQHLLVLLRLLQGPADAAPSCAGGPGGGAYVACKAAAAPATTAARKTASHPGATRKHSDILTS